MIEELVSRVFGTRNAAHLAHWATDSFAEHSALGDFYDDVIDALDAIIEAYQGAFGKIGAVKVQDASVTDIVKHLLDEAKWIDENRDKIAQGNRTIEARLDDFGEVYLKTLYKLENLDGKGKSRGERWYTKEAEK